jgi:hypothetical protein
MVTAKHPILLAVNSVNHSALSGPVRKSDILWQDSSGNAAI